MSEFYSYAAGITSLIIAICYGIYWLIHYVMASKRSHSQPFEDDLESHSNTVDDAEDSTQEGELWAEASAQSLLLDMAAIEAANRMNAVASECKDETF